MLQSYVMMLHMSAGTEWTLVDARAMATMHPNTFEIPTSDEIKSLKKGSLVKLIFDITDRKPGQPLGEKMWVEITSIKNDDYTGRLDNDPKYIKSLHTGSEVDFEVENIASIWVDSLPVEPRK